MACRWVRVRWRAARQLFAPACRRTRQKRQVSCAMTRLISQSIERGREHERHETRLGPAVENVARQDEPAIPPSLGRADERVVAQQRERQEVVDKNVRAKNHAGV